MNAVHLDILDDARRSLLPELDFLRDQRFYLAGGTALALQIGHRDSIDFDFFRNNPIEDTSALFEELRQTLHTHTLLKTQEERNTLGIILDEAINISFMTFPHPLIEPHIHTPHLNLASIMDIGCMKLSAITGRATWKDYIDLYFITNEIPLASLIKHLPEKLPDLDPMLALKSLTYFEDLQDEPIRYKVAPPGRAEVVSTLTKRVREVS